MKLHIGNITAKGRDVKLEAGGFVLRGHRKVAELRARAKMILNDQSGEGFIDTALKILISVVIGALLLAGLYALFQDTILPELTNRIKDLFDYKG